MKKDILVKNVDVNLLRQQRGELLKHHGANPQVQETFDGIINLLDNMLDVAEGFL